MIKHDCARGRTFEVEPGLHLCLTLRINNWPEVSGAASRLPYIPLKTEEHVFQAVLFAATGRDDIA